MYSLTASSVAGEGQSHAAVLFVVDSTERDQAERQRQEFTANVSHELKTPLTSIMGYAEIMENGIVKPEDVAPFAGKMCIRDRSWTGCGRCWDKVLVRPVPLWYNDAVNCIENIPTEETYEAN